MCPDGTLPTPRPPPLLRGLNLPQRMRLSRVHGWFAARLVEGRERLDERGPLRGGEAFDDGADLRAAAGGDLLDRTPPLVGELEQGLAPVVGVGLTECQTCRDEPVHHAHRGRRGDLEQFGEDNELGGAACREHHQHPQLRQRHPLLHLAE